MENSGLAHHARSRFEDTPTLNLSHPSAEPAKLELSTTLFRSSRRNHLRLLTYDTQFQIASEDWSDGAPNAFHFFVLALAIQCNIFLSCSSSTQFFDFADFNGLKK